MRKCKDCKNVYPSTKEYFYKIGKYLRRNCKKCEYVKRKARPSGSQEYMKRYDLNRRYGITLEKYEEIWNFQGGKCAICDSILNRVRNKKDQSKTACLDHYHKNEKIRGILCERCNVGIGCFLDDEKIIRKAARYLRYNFPNGNFKKNT